MKTRNTSFISILCLALLFSSCGDVSTENSLDIDDVLRYIKDINKEQLLYGSIPDDQNMFLSTYSQEFRRWDFTSVDKNTGFRGEMYMINSGNVNLYAFTPTEAKLHLERDAQEWGDQMKNGLSSVFENIIEEKRRDQIWDEDSGEMPKYAVIETQIRDIEIELLEEAKEKSMSELNLYQWHTLMEKSPVSFALNCEYLVDVPHNEFEHAGSQGIFVSPRIAILQEDYSDLISDLENAYNDADWDREYDSSDCQKAREIIRRNRAKQEKLVAIYKQVLDKGVHSISEDDLIYWNCESEKDEVGAGDSHDQIYFRGGESHHFYHYKFSADPDTSNNRIIRGSVVDWSRLSNDIETTIDEGELTTPQQIYDQLKENRTFSMQIVQISGKNNIQMWWSWPETQEYSNRGLLHEFAITDEQVQFFNEVWENLYREIQ